MMLPTNKRKHRKDNENREKKSDLRYVRGPVELKKMKKEKNRRT